MSKKRISILGSTGSIGVSALDVIAGHPEMFEVTALAAGSNIDLLSEQIERFRPRLVSVKTEGLRTKLRTKVGGSVPILAGIDGAVQVATVHDSDIVLSAMVGVVGLKPTFEAIMAGKDIALANKETLSAAGELMIAAARERGARLLPVDSEHSAVFQSLQGHNPADVKRIILTASGGPFWNFDGDLSKVTPEQALKHPNWSMGAKITIDSATMMNKGLEIIEARWLFGLPEDRIDVIIHPQSIIHSMVEYKDGSTIAQLACPDMRGPISYALAYPDRIENNAEFIGWARLKTLSFHEPDLRRFPILSLARQAIRAGGSMCAAMNAANEIAVQKFLDGKIRFTDIYNIVAGVMDVHTLRRIGSIEDVMEVDREARALAEAAA